MLSLLVYAPLLLVAPAAAAPSLLQKDDVQSGPGGGACVVATITVTETVWTDPTPAPTVAGAGPEVSPLVFTDKYSPAVATQPALGNPASPDTYSAPAPAPEQPQQQYTAPAAAPSPSVASSGPAAGPDVAEPEGIDTTDHFKGSYTNALYFTNWGIYGADYQPQQLPVSEITRVLYAFADIGSDGEVKSSDAWSDYQKHYPTDSWNDQGNNAYGCVKQLFLLKKQNRHLKVLLSIGGWTYSPKFPPIAATEAGRQKFASSAVKLVQDWGFDGIDIDWEYPSNPTEAQNFVLLLQACRAALDAYAAQHAPGYHFQITVASPAGAQHYNAMDLSGMDRYVDAWHLMAYDYAGGWDTTSGHQANIYANGANPASTKFSTEQAVRDYISHGISPSKIVLGMPLYGRSFESTGGLGQPYSGTGGNPQAGGQGVWLYRDLPRPGAKVVYDDVAKASYSYDENTKELISFDTVDSAVAKAGYLVSRGLGGAVFWEASGDKKGSESLVGTLADRMGRLDSAMNLLSYPASQYDNIRKGMPS
ncbi:glycoside hydrolase family 18 protein [Echria macrotheca]|uniref:chitinase n=1 Tax=Echria macrotheca TaxID=438768 RepID=A0AAJ0F5T5_9PEZI|nr:glycoside hydrolase family 18 protein [Echria macrotheca]